MSFKHINIKIIIKYSDKNSVYYNLKTMRIYCMEISSILPKWKYTNGCTILMYPVLEKCNTFSLGTVWMTLNARTVFISVTLHVGVNNFSIFTIHECMLYTMRAGHQIFPVVFTQPHVSQITKQLIALKWNIVFHPFMICGFLFLPEKVMYCCCYNSTW